MKPRLFVLAVSAMLLASCGGTPTEKSSAEAPNSSVNDTSSSVAPIAKKLTGISLDTANVKKAYLFNSLMPATLNDELDATGLKVIANYDDGTTSEIATSEVLVTGPDLGAVGEGDVTVTYRGKQATYPVKVGSYKATAADIALVNDEIGNLPHLLALSRRMMKTIRWNLVFAMGLNFAAIVLAITGFLGPVVGALVHNAGSVLVHLRSGEDGR